MNYFKKEENMECPLLSNQFNFASLFGKITNSSSLPLSCALWIQQNEP
jgi:hypothetical protein